MKPALATAAPLPKITEPQIEFASPKNLFAKEEKYSGWNSGRRRHQFQDFSPISVFPEVRVANPPAEKPVVPRASSAPSASSSSTSSSFASSTSSVAKTHSELDKDMQMLQKFYNGVTAALDRLTKAVEKQTIEPKRFCRTYVHDIEQLKEGVKWLRTPPPTPVFFLLFSLPCLEFQIRTCKERNPYLKVYLWLLIKRLI